MEIKAIIVGHMIRNKSNGNVVCESYEIAESAWQRTRGLMFRGGLPRGHGLLMTFQKGSKPGIWMLGMRFPIDIIFLDSGKRVTKVVENARPIGLSWRSWRIFRPEKPARFVLELPAGMARESRIRIGDVLGF